MYKFKTMVSSSNGFELNHPWYNGKASNQACAGSTVIYVCGSEIVLDNRVDASHHDNSPLHMNLGARVGLSGCELQDRTSFLKRCDRKLGTELHFLPL